LLELFCEDQLFIRQIIGTAEETFPYLPSYALPTQPGTWHHGSVVLAGDAVYAISPSSGQGVSMALEDAVVLAKCLRDIHDVEQAFATSSSCAGCAPRKCLSLGSAVIQASS
jgi:flavin-dependent dehydrogenase